MLLLRRLLPLLLPLSALAAPIGEDGARLLLQRTGFGAPPAAIRQLAPLERAQAVDRVLDEAHHVAQTPPPGWAEQELQLPPRRDMSEEEKKAFQREEQEKGLALRGWWLQEMYASHSQISEKMTLFWHNHFVSALEKVKVPELMYQQNVLLRRDALGNFATLLHDVARDPAMLRYLDTAANRKGQPNENFAREVMELFTLGEGHYSEQDIREAARAFTGWSLQPGSISFVYRPRQHDDGSKTVFGRSGNFDGDEVLDLLLARPETSRFITRKLWLYLVSPQVDEQKVQQLAASFARDYEIKPLLRKLLLSDAFWRSAGQQVKSPLELTVGTLRTFEQPAPDWRALAVLNRGMGQDVFNPPNVRGWPGGEAWINSATLLARKQFLDRLWRDGGNRPAMDPAARPLEKRAERSMNQLVLPADDWLQGTGLSMAQLPHYLLALPPTQPLAANLPASQTLRALLMDPAYQVE
ncbi:DUF1800 family protein [Vogesella sp. LIG4]|uniref:DUF1800 domain-containing protein n=1 Tax=Vogesella sp. LIG4 TaxID=1192162 RepID=UPI00081FBE8E|nr:DUF1800 domain-containing protein [Vogesella sp. LIG4]SCK29275.1 Uncharacterized conserved protein, DUF1800 family [Vogesella sp. LIG4]